MQKKTSRFVRLSLVLLAAAALVYLLYKVREILLTFCMAALIAYVCFRPVIAIEKKGLKRTWAILLFYSVFLAFLALVLWVTIPIMIKEIGDLARILPQYAQQAQQLSGAVQNSPMPARIGSMISDNIASVENAVYDSLRNFLNSLDIFFSRVIAIIFSPILAFYIMNDWERLKDGFLGLFTPAGRRDAIFLFHKIDLVLIEFIKGNLLVAVIVGCAIGATAAILGVRLPLLIGLGAAIAELIPFFGAFLGAVPALIISFSQSLKTGLYMALAVVIIQQLEGNILTPRIVGARLGMHPLLMVFALLAGGELFGIWGLLAAVPLVAVLKVTAVWLFERMISSNQENMDNKDLLTEPDISRKINNKV